MEGGWQGREDGGVVRRKWREGSRGGWGRSETKGEGGGSGREGM